MYKKLYQIIFSNVYNSQNVENETSFELLLLKLSFTIDITSDEKTNTEKN